MPYEHCVVQTYQGKPPYNGVNDLTSKLNEGWSIVTATSASSGTGTGWIEYVLRRERQPKEE